MPERTAAGGLSAGRPVVLGPGRFLYAAFRYLPLQTSREVVGVLGVRFGSTGDALPGTGTAAEHICYEAAT